MVLMMTETRTKGTDGVGDDDGHISVAECRQRPQSCVCRYCLSIL